MTSKGQDPTLTTVRIEKARSATSIGLFVPRCALALAVGASIATAKPASAQASLFPAQIDLSALDGSKGFVVNGESVSDRSGYSVSAAGDINGDGIDDLIIGADSAAPNGSDSGRSYVVFGRAALFRDRFEANPAPRQ